VKGFSTACGNKFPKKALGLSHNRRYTRFARLMLASGNVLASTSEEGRVTPGGEMRVWVGGGVLSVVLVTAGGLVGGISAHGQAPPASNATGSSQAYSTSNKSAGKGTSSGDASVAAKAAMPAADPPAGGGNVPQDSKTPAAPKAKTEDSYIVGVSDSLLISVWKEPDFSGPVVVRPDGVITVPVVGDVHVAGLTTTQVQEIITEKLKGVVTEPQVTVVVRDIKSRKVYLMGKVGKVGAVPLLGHETVLQLLAESGGPEKFAKTKKIYILRVEGDHTKRIEFPYKKVLAGTEPDIELEVGDVIVVP
jgi:polysaccharide biosynthesis/export protein